MQRGHVNHGRRRTLLAVDQGELPEWHNKILTVAPHSGEEDGSVVDITEYARSMEGYQDPT